MLRNQVARANFIRLGQRLSLPVSREARTVASPRSAAMPADERYHVQTGDTLSDRCAFGLTTAALAKFNSLHDADAIFGGQFLAFGYRRRHGDAIDRCG